MKKYLQLAALIFRYGSLKGSGQNFNHDRAKSLENLQEFVPQKQAVKTSLSQKKSGSNLIAQAAFIKSAFTMRGGHLCVDNLCYIRIPKAANTSIGYEMLLKKYSSLKNTEVDETQINFLSDVNLREIQDTGTETFFTVVRNPFARLVSVYRDFFEKIHDDFIYQDYLFGILKQKMSFAQFVTRISRIPDRLKDQHLRPQHLFIEPYERWGVTLRILQLEERHNLERFMNEHEMELRHRNKSPEPYDYTSYYTPGLIEAVYSIYRKDIKKLGYTQVYEELKRQFRH